MPTHVRKRLADTVWQDLSRLVLDNKDTWRRAAVAETGLSFTRVRIQHLQERQPLTVKQVAEAATIDAPAATVAVNDLEDRGLVIRQTDPANRRCKRVSLTDAGQAMVSRVRAIDDPAPEALAALDDHDLAALAAILAKINRL